MQEGQKHCFTHSCVVWLVSFLTALSWKWAYSRCYNTSSITCCYIPGFYGTNIGTIILLGNTWKEAQWCEQLVRTDQKWNHLWLPNLSSNRNWVICIASPITVEDRGLMVWQQRKPKNFCTGTHSYFHLRVHNVSGNAVHCRFYQWLRKRPAHDCMRARRKQHRRQSKRKTWNCEKSTP